ncbi:putative Ig domain-containing protein [Lysobacter capsici]|uniref:putative Ig domain-containing protein n=2 Tax=Lysobacter capsici TaxID=435897 RepID=UPI00287BB29C|nr:putative Ig domain-containing protein [Lysobacter capsici]WND82018.1 putative Ig domain-containing protein [Lysobacter capsici]WND87214.1 putative Ig domain-containing protein [Lysobacter capsici]
MSAVISGNGLGLFNGSASQLGTGLGGGARLGQGKDNQYVNIATGNLLLQSQDEQLLFRGMTIAAQRTYNSRGLLADVGADAWITGFERRVELLSGTLNAAGSVMRRYSGDGSYQDFAFVSADLYRSTTGDGAHDTLNRDGATSTWTWVEGSTRREEQYANHADATLKGRLTRIRDLKSDGVSKATWNVVYDASNRVSEVQAVEGGPQEALIFGYDANGRLSTLSTRINGVVNEQVTYGYDGSGRLSSVLVDLTPADAVGDRDVWDTSNFANNDGYRFHTVYTYVDATSLQLSQVRQSDGTLVSYTYDAQGRVRTLTRGDVNTDDSDGAGQTLTFTYDTANRSTEVADSTGRSWGYVYDAAGQLIEVRSPAVSGVRDLTQYSYDASGNVTRVKAVRGSATLSETVYQYDANGNVLWQWNTVNPASGTAATAVQRTYTATNQLASETVYTGLDADRELAAQAPSGGLTTSYVYDAQDRVRFVIDALGAVHEFEYETVGAGAGQVSKSRQYLGAAYSGAMTLAGLTAWATTSQRAQSTLSESTYNGKGRLSGTKTYSSVDASGNGVENDATEIVQYLYDAHGLLTQRRLMRSSTTAVDDGRDVSHTTTYLYDGMDRLRSEVVTEKVGAGSDQLRRIVSQWTYQDSGASVRMVIEGGTVNDGVTSNDLLRVEVRDKAGQLISVTDSAFSGGAARTVSKNYYDTAGRLRASEDAGGARSYFFYDEEGQLAAQVDETGAVIEFIRDDLGRVIQTKSYATRVDASTWVTAGKVVPATVAAIRPAASADDRVNTSTYDALGRLLTQKSGSDGATTTHSYDGAGRRLQTTAQDSAGNTRTIRYFYDASGRQTGQLDAEGYLVEHSYDLAGRRIASKAYATVTASAQRAAGTLAQLRPANAAADQLTRWFYDGRGNVVGELNAEGYLTEYVFDEARNERAVLAYAKQLTGLSGSETLATLHASAITGALRETRRGYDVVGRLSTERNPEGTVTRYTYDAQGRVLRTETAADTSEVREGRLRHNVFGELIGELDGEGSTRVTAGMTETQLDAIYAQYGVRHNYNNLGQRIESIDAAGNKTWYFYDRRSRLTHTVRGVANAAGVLNAEGELRKNVYDAFGDTMGVYDFQQRLILATAGSRTAAETAINGLDLATAIYSLQTIRYNDRGQVARVIDTNGVTNRYTYNAFGDRIKEELAVDTAAASTTSFQYDKRGLLTARTDAVGKAEQRSVGSVYDAFGRIISATDGRGIATIYTYDRLGRQLTASQTVMSRQELVSTSYDAYGRVLSVTDALGRTTTSAYDTTNRTTTVTTPEGVSVTTTFNRHGQQVNVATPLPGGTFANTSYLYDRDGNLKSTTDALGRADSNEYDVRGLLSATVDRTGRRVELRYDAVGRLLQRIEDPAGFALTTIYRYDGQGRQSEVTDASGRKTAYSYDREGRLTQVAADPAGLNLRTTYTYDALGRQITVTEGAGTAQARTIQYDYDALGRRTAERLDPAGLNLITSYAYDANDHVVRRTDATGNVTRFYYDEADRMIYTVDPLGVMTRNWFDVTGKVVATRTFIAATDASTLTDTTTIAQLDARIAWNPLDPGSYTVYDRDGRARLVLSTIGAIQEFTYDAAGRVSVIRNYATLWTDFGTTMLNKLFAGTAQLSDFNLDALRNDAATDRARDLVTYQVFTVLGELRTTVDNSGTVISYVYDAAGRQTVHKRYMHAAQLNPTIRAKLVAGTASPQDVIDVTPVDNATDLVDYTTYDSAGRAHFSVDAYGAVVELLYDAAGRTVGTRAYATAITIDATLKAQLIAGDPLAEATLRSRTTAIANDARDLRSYQVYDSAGRVAATVDSAGYISTRSYDAAGRVIMERRHAQAATINAALWAKLATGTATVADIAAVAVQNTSTDAVVRRIYDAAGRERYTLTQNSASTYLVSERRYDGAGRVTAQYQYNVAIALGPVATPADVNAALNAAGAYASADRYRSTQYVFDAAGRVRFTIDNIGAVNEQRFDGAGRVIETRRYGGYISIVTPMNEAAVSAAVAGIADVRKTTTTYDAMNRVVRVTDALNQYEEYTYNPLGQVTALRNKNGNVWNYEYDTAGRRTAEISPDVWIASVDAAGTQSYGVRRIATRTEYDALGNVIRRLEDADGGRARITRYEYDNRGNQIRTIFPDAGKIDPANGQLIASGIQPTIEIIYDALGRAVVQKDVRGNYSYKVYDALGQLAYDIDQENYVTRNSYDGFGQKTQLRRYEARLNTAAIAGWSAGQPITLAQIETAGAVVAGAQDRTITTRYDQRGLAVQIEQAQVTYYTAAGVAATGSPTVRVEYDGFGNKVKESILLQGTAGQADARWADSYTYYDLVGRVTMTVDAEGYVTRSQYNATGEVTETVEFARAISTIGLTTLAPPNTPPAGDDISGYDRTIRYGYDALGRKSIQAVVRHFQRNDGSSGVRDVFTQFRYNGENRVTEVIDDTGITKTDYDSLGNAVSVTEPVRAVINDITFQMMADVASRDLMLEGMYEYVSPFTNMIYDAFGNIVLTRRFANGKNAAGNVIANDNKDQIDRIRYDWQGRAVVTIDSNDQSTYSDYDAADNVTHRWTVLSGSEAAYDVRVHSWYSYDNAGRQTGTSQTRDLLNGGGSGTDQSEAVVYNAFGEIVQKTYAGIAGSLNYGYDGAGRLITSNETFVVKNFGYNLAGHQVREAHVVATSDGQKVDAITWNTTDRLGRTTATRLPSHTADPNATTNVQQRLDRWGNVLEVIDARGYRTNYQYNESNQVVRDERPIVQVVSDTGAVSWVRPVNQWFYDALGRLIGTRDANGNTRSNEYDAAGRLVATRDALGQATRFAFDALGNQRITQNPLGYLTYQDYDRLGRVIQIGDYLANGAGGRTRSALQRYVLNQNGDRVQVFDALNNLARYEYDSQHRLLLSRTAMGVSTGYVYDTQGRKIYETLWSINASTLVDRDGETVRLHQLSWDYDVYGRLTDHNNLSGRDLDYAYDATTGQLTAESWANGPSAYAIRYTTYYANGLIKALYEYGPNPTYRYEYDAAGNRTLEEVNTTDAGGKVVHTITRTWYDSNNRIQRVVQDDLSNGAAKRAFDLTYSYDAVGNRRRVQASAGYGPDSAEVPAINTAPQLVQSPPSRSVHKGATTEFALVFNEIFLDAQQDPLTLQISLADGSPLPAWLTARRDAATGQIIFTAQPAANAADQDLSIRLLASETGNPGNAAATTFTLYVRSNVGPQVFNTAPETIPVKVGTNLTKTLRAGDYFYDLDIGDQLRLSIDNLSSLPAWLQIDPATMLLRADPTAVGVFAVMLRATDQNGLSVIKTLHVNAAANSAPTGPSPLPAVAAMRNNDFSWSSPLSQVFTDPDGDNLTVAASGLPAWLSFQRIDNPVRPELRLIGRVPDDIPAGTVYTVSFTATDTSGATKTTTLAITVRNGNQAPSAPTSFGLSPAAVGYAYSAQLPPFTDPDGDAITYQVAPLPPGLSFDAASRTISGVASAAGEFNVFYTATDQFGASSRMSFFMRSFVNRPPVASSIPNQTTSVGTPFVYEIPRFSDPDSWVAHSATGLPPGLNMGSDGTITGTANTAGSYTVTVTGSDGMVSVSTNFIFTVNAVAPPNRGPVPNYAPQDVYMEVSESAGVSGGTGWPGDAFIDPDGNPLTYQLINSPPWVEYSYGGSFGGHQFDFFPPGQTRTYTVTVRATDSFGAFADMSFTVRVFYRSGGGVPLSQPSGPAESSLSFDMAPESESAGTATAASTMASTPTPIDVRDYWFTYDAENRIAINNGRMVNGQIVLTAQGGDSYQLGYDAAGRAVTRTFYRGNDLKVQRSDFDLRGNRTIEFQEQRAGSSYYGGIERVFIYDAANRQLGSRSYIAAGETYTYTSRPGEIYEEYDTYEIGGWLSQAENFAYDADGRLIYQEHWTRNGDLADWVRQAAQNNANGRQATDTSVLTLRKSRVDYLDANGQSTYDGSGKATSYRTFAPGYMHTYTVTYEGWESYQEKTVSGVSTDNNYKPTTNTLSYDAYGRLIAQVENTRLKNGALDDRVRYYAYNGDGQVQTRREGTLSNGQFTQTGTTKPNYLFAYAGGQQMAQVREGALGIVSLNGMGMYEAGGGKVTALAGESLRDLAKRVYGNEQQWYVLAQANGLGDPEQEIGGGLMLDVPNVDVSRNDAGTFKPYNPGEAIGSTTPSLPYIPPPKAACSSVAKVIVLVVVVAVAAFTGGTILAALPTAGTLGLGTAVFIGGVAGAAGALAGQAAGSFMGISSFSWRAVAAGAITGAITGGIAEIAGGAAAGFGGAADGAEQAVSATAGFGRVAAQAIGNPLAAYAGDRIAGLDASFSWRNIVASTFTNLVASYAGPAISDRLKLTSNFSRNFTQGMTAGVVSAATRNVMGIGEGLDLRAIVSDAFGNALGNLIGNAGANSYDSSQTSNGGVSETESWTLSPADSAQRPFKSSRSWNGIGLAFGYGFDTGSGLNGMGSFTSNSSRPTQATGYVVGEHERGAKNLDILLVTTNERFNQFYMGLWDWTNRYRQTGLTASTHGGTKGIVNYWAEKTASLTPAYSHWLRNSAAVRIGGSPIESENTSDARLFENSRKDTRDYYDGFRGSLLGDMAANAGTIFSHAGIGIAQGVNSLYNILTDKRSRDEAISGAVKVAFNPVDTYWKVVGATSDFMGMSSDEQWRIIGTGAVSFVATAGTEAILSKGLTLTTQLAEKAAIKVALALDSPSNRAGSVSGLFLGDEIAPLGFTGSSFTKGPYLHEISPRSNIEIYGSAATRSVDEAKELLIKLGYDSDDLAKYHFIKINEETYERMVNARNGSHFDATYGNVSNRVDVVSFRDNIESVMANGERKVPIWIRDKVFESDEHIVQSLTHEIFEIEELRYDAYTPIPIYKYNNMISPYNSGNLHHQATKIGDRAILDFRRLLLEGKL